MRLSETGEAVYRRTYSRKLPDGSNETWPQTVRRVVDGNLALVDDRYQLPGERDDLIRLMTEFKIVPAGRHLWASGVKGAQHLMNCWVSHWTDTPSDHFEFTFMRLMEGGGVGTNYSNSYLADYPAVRQTNLTVEIVCDPEHPDYEQMFEQGLISQEYDSDWDGAFLVEDSREGWAGALVDLIDTFYRTDSPHRYRVYDVSNVRAAGARLKTFGGTASGPDPFARMMIDVCEILNETVQLTGIDAMKIDHAIAQCVVSGGVRRSARMAMMKWDDPQIDEFLTIKQDSGSHWTTNISVVVDDEFWSALRGGSTSEWLEDAEDVLGQIAAGMHSNGEPGFFDISYANQGEPDEVVCTNPCGEITLNAWEPCNLGHVNLAAFAETMDGSDLALAHRLMTRFLIRATFAQVSDPKSRAVLDRNRRIGVGHLGVASYLAMNATTYAEGPESRWFTEGLRALAYEVDHAAIEFCNELRIPVPVKLRTVAPTGTIAKMPGVSEGIHPIFSKYFIRRIRFSTVDEDQRAQLDDYRQRGFDVEPCQYAANTAVVSIPTKDSLVADVADVWGESAADQIVQGADELTLDEMLRFQAMYQTVWADNAVSYTANFDPAEYSAAEIEVLLRRYGGKLKGATVFPEVSMPQSPYQRLTREQYELYQTVDIADGVDEECASGVGCPIR